MPEALGKLAIEKYRTKNRTKNRSGRKKPETGEIFCLEDVWLGKMRELAKEDQMESFILSLNDALTGIKPLLTGESGAYLGIYEPSAKKICDIMGWEHNENSR